MAMDKKDISYRLFMMQLSYSLTQDNIADLKYFYESFVPPAQSEKISKGIDLFVVLERANLLGPNKLDTLRIGFEAIQRGDLLEKIEKQATDFANQFNEEQKNLQGMLQGHQYLGDSMEHDGPGDEKVPMRHGNLGDEQLKKLHEDLDAWNVDDEVQADVETEVPQDTDAEDSSGNIEKFSPDPKKIIFGQSDVVPDGVGDTQPDGTSHVKSHKQQKPDSSKMPSELEDKGYMYIKGQLLLQKPLKPSPKQNKLITCNSGGVFMPGRGDERPETQPPEDRYPVKPDLHEKSPSCGPDGESANKHGSMEPTETPSEDEQVGNANVHEQFSGPDPDEQSASGHGTKKCSKQPSEDECSEAHQKGKTIPVAPTGTEKDGPGGLATPNLGSLAFSEDASPPSNTAELTLAGEDTASSGAWGPYSSLGEHSFDPGKLAQLNPQQQEIFAKALAAECKSVLGGAFGGTGPFQGNSCGALPTHCGPYNGSSGPAQFDSFGNLGTLSGSSFGATWLAQGTSCGASGFTQGSHSYMETVPKSTQGASAVGSISEAELTSHTSKEGFVVQISGGKHENTADGAKVIMPKNEVNFTITVVNENPYDAELDISYGETYLGWWLLQPGVPLIVEGPSYETGQLFYSAVDNFGKKDKLGSTKPSSVIKCTFKPDSDAIKLYIETAQRQRPGMITERFDVVWPKSKSIETLREKVQAKIKTQAVAGLVAHSELLQPPDKTLRKAGVESGHTIKVLFSEQKLYVKLPDGKLLEPAMTVNPLGVSVDDIRNYVQEHTNHSQFRQRLTFQEQELSEDGELLAVLVSENPVIELEVAEDLTFLVKYPFDDNGEVKYEEKEFTEHSFTKVRILKNKVEQLCEDEVVLKLGNTELDDESKSLQHYGVASGATLQATTRSQGPTDRSVLRGGHFDWGSDDSDDDDDSSWLFDNPSGTRGVGGRKGLRFRNYGDDSSDESEEEIAGKIIVTGNKKTNQGLVADDVSRTFQEELKVVIRLKLVTRPSSKTTVGACGKSTPEPLPVAE